jgi:type I protein arginine methyltransferase
MPKFISPYFCQASFTMLATEDGTAGAYVGFFDTEFKGSTENPATVPVTLSTAPDATGATHWGQQSFLLQPTLDVHNGDRIECEFHMQRRRENHRLLEIKLNHTLVPASGGKGIERVSHFVIE